MTLTLLVALVTEPLSAQTNFITASQFTNSQPLLQFSPYANELFRLDGSFRSVSLSDYGSYAASPYTVTLGMGIHQEISSIGFLSDIYLLQNKEPEPYSSDEFPRWLLDLARFEAIFVGALPVTMFYAAIGYDLYRLITNSLEDNSFKSEYLPELVNSQHAPFTQEEQTNLILVGLAGATVVATIDYIIHISRRSRNPSYD